MASLIIDNEVTVSNQLGGAVAFWIMGQLHWKVGAVHGNSGRYIQTYLYVQQQNQQHMAAFPQQHQQWALEIVDKIWVALEESNNTYILKHSRSSTRMKQTLNKPQDNLLKQSS